MIDALYGIEFISSMNVDSQGVVILEEGRILGGNSSFVYRGSYQYANGILEANLRIINDQKKLTSILIFGNEGEINLFLEGSVMNHHQFSLKDPDMSLEVRFIRRAELPQKKKLKGMLGL